MQFLATLGKLKQVFSKHAQLAHDTLLVLPICVFRCNLNRHELSLSNTVTLYTHHTCHSTGKDNREKKRKSKGVTHHGNLHFNPIVIYFLISYLKRISLLHSLAQVTMLKYQSFLPTHNLKRQCVHITGV